jgi:hypothetical protein
LIEAYLSEGAKDELIKIATTKYKAKYDGLYSHKHKGEDPSFVYGSWEDAHLFLFPKSSDREAFQSFIEKQYGFDTHRWADGNSPALLVDMPEY